MKNFRKVCRGEKGFTLVELLVVIVILGILAAVAAVSIMRFMSAGNVSAANEELHQVKTALAGAMFDAKVSEFTTVGSVGPGDTLVADGVDIGSGIDGTLKGTYAVSENGTVTGTDPGKWGTKVTWDATEGGWK